MYIVALAWIYVVLMMSITETSVVAGVMTFVMYGVIPVTIILYVMGTPQRRRRRILEEKLRRESALEAAAKAGPDPVPEATPDPDTPPTPAAPGARPET
jgi:predicted DNA repair protein MutK